MGSPPRHQGMRSEMCGGCGAKIVDVGSGRGGGPVAFISQKRESGRKPQNLGSTAIVPRQLHEEGRTGAHGLLVLAARLRNESED